MPKDPPPAKDLQVAFDLGDEASNPPPALPGGAKKAEANPEKPAGKLVKKREGGRKPVRERVQEKKAGEPHVSKPVTAAQSDRQKTVSPQISEKKTESTNSTVDNDAPILSMADEAGAPTSPPEKEAAPQSERPMPAKGPEPVTGNGAEPAGRPPTEIPASEKIANEETERIIQLINTHEGCWKVLPGGERVALSDQEWRSELARHFRREAPAGG